MVDNEVTLTFDQLVELPLIEQYVTIACVSNEVGGNLVGNAKWTGVQLTRRARDGRRPGRGDPDRAALGRRLDRRLPDRVGHRADRAREAMIAVRMNDEPLPAPHGFPARLIVPGLYGYVSATKWLSEHRAHDARGVRRLLGPARLVEGGADPDPVADRRAARRTPASAPGRSRSPASPGRPTAASAGSRSRSTTATWQNATIATPIGPQTWVQWKCDVARRRPAST